MTKQERAEIYAELYGWAWQEAGYSTPHAPLTPAMLSELRALRAFLAIIARR